MEKARKGNRVELPFYWMIAKAVLLGVIVTGLILMVFAFLIASADLSQSLASPLASVAAGAGAFAAGFYLSKKTGNKGLLCGLLVGGILFLILTLISLVVDPSGIGILTLLHAVIVILAATIGGIFGVNVGKSRKIV